MNALARMFPYVANRNETLAQQTARLLRELAAASQPRAADNDNAGERKAQWWLGW